MPPSLIWDTWSKDPIKGAILGAVISCQARLGRAGFVGWNIADALIQTLVCFHHAYLLDLEEVHY